MVGRTIGKYRVVAKLGRGGMGTVYKAVDETLDREVAIKILNPDFAEGDVMKRFRAEASVMAELNHPSIATIYELHRSDDDLVMVMEFVRGESLDQFVQRSGPIEPERAAYLLSQVLDAIGHAHAAGIIHRDLKPSNVMVTEHGAVKIMDFGIARVRGAEHMTTDGYMMGTPAYMSPEQVLSQEVDGRSDLYSVGVMFYRLLTGKLPFEADTGSAWCRNRFPTCRRRRACTAPTCRRGPWRSWIARSRNRRPIDIRRRRSCAARCSMRFAAAPLRRRPVCPRLRWGGRPKHGQTRPTPTLKPRWRRRCPSPRPCRFRHRLRLSRNHHRPFPRLCPSQRSRSRRAPLDPVGRPRWPLPHQRKTTHRRLQQR
jgi:serine/threonine protein kinase